MCLYFLSRDLADNKVFFQHPDLMRALAIHETVMQLMVNTLNKAQHQTVATVDNAAKRRSSVASNTPDIEVEAAKVGRKSATIMGLQHTSLNKMAVKIIVFY